MNKIYCVVLFVLLFLLDSCIPLKDLHYLQSNGNKNSETTITPVVVKPYRLQPNDILSIRIKALDQRLVEMFNTSANSQSSSGESLYFDGFIVDDHGNIRIPVLGEISVMGLTIDEVRLTVEKQLLTQYFNKEADIFVSVKLAGLRYTINGEVGSPGTKTLLQEKVTILEAVANSGDISITGNRKDVMIVRQFPHGTEIHTIDLTTIDALNSPYYYVQPNDYIYVKALKQKTWGTGTNGVQSFTTLLSAFTLLMTTFFLLKK